MVLIDGTLIATQRRTGKADRRNYSGKHHHHGLHFLALSDERGRLIWISTARPHPRQHRRPPGARPGPPARRRPQGAGGPRFRSLDNDVLAHVIVTGFHTSRTHKLTPGQKTATRVLAIGRAPVEHGFAHLNNWRSRASGRTRRRAHRCGAPPRPARCRPLLRASARRGCQSVRRPSRRTVSTTR
ncbi:transposase family protein [Streptomyces nogalater]|uniref:Transposase family protein n=1 Tax=Streptomyces nogalater TaxID=38314 RepID=A0ABW0WRQ2_STRNO